MIPLKRTPSLHLTIFNCSKFKNLRNWAQTGTPSSSPNPPQLTHTCSSAAKYLHPKLRTLESERRYKWRSEKWVISSVLLTQNQPPVGHVTLETNLATPTGKKQSTRWVIRSAHSLQSAIAKAFSTNKARPPTTVRSSHIDALNPKSETGLIPNTSTDLQSLPHSLLTPLNTALMAGLEVVGCVLSGSLGF